MLPETIIEQMCRPEGTVEFRCEVPDLFNLGHPTLLVFEVVSGAQYFRLERTSSFSLSFFHSSPGTGTRVATVDLSGTAPFKKAFIALVWSTKELMLYVGNDEGNRSGGLFQAKGTTSERLFMVGEHGQVFEVNGMKTMQFTAYTNGEQVLRPTALDTWKSTIAAVSVLLGGSSKEVNLFEIVAANLSISTLVTGLEGYCKSRFRELQREGVVPNLLGLNKLLPKTLRDSGEVQECKTPHDRVRFFQKAVELINFQNYRKSRDAFRETYGLDFANMGASLEHLERVNFFIKHRHRVIHVSPLIGTVRISNVQPSQPTFVNRGLASEASECLESFVEKLHTSSLGLNRTD